MSSDRAGGNPTLLACVGLEDVVVIETADAVMVARKDKAQAIGPLVAKLKAAGRAECLAHRKVHRPWGSYDGIESGERFQVKRITVHGNVRVSAGEVRVLVDGLRGSSILTADLASYGGELARGGGWIDRAQRLLDQRRLEPETELYYCLRALQRTLRIWVQKGLIVVSGIDPDKPKTRPKKKANFPTRKLQSRNSFGSKHALWQPLSQGEQDHD